jgi:hypothetical protein
MIKSIYKLSLFLLLAATGGCASCQQELAEAANKAVMVEYDYLMSFASYRFNDPPARISGGITLYTGSEPTGFWAVFLICSIDNRNPLAETFMYDVKRWYVEFEGNRWYYSPILPRGKYSGYSAGGNSNPANMVSWLPHEISEAENSRVSAQFRSEVILGPDSQQFPKGGPYHVPIRIAIFVASEKRYRDPTRAELRLMYDGFPVIAERRTDSVGLFNPEDEVTGFRTMCRPPD